MPRVARIDIENHWYHVISRGINRVKIFLEPNDYQKYLKLLDETLKKFNGYVGAYCLMPNHIHLLIFRKEYPLQKIFHDVQGRYSLYFNKKNRRTGYLFQGRYKSKIILSDKYLDTLVNYIHQNPIRARMAARVNGYLWSSDKYYRKFIDINRLNRFKRVPGYEGREGEKKYMDIVTDSVEYPKFYQQYIGSDESFPKEKYINKKKEKEKPDIDKRVEELIGGAADLLKKLKSKSRKRNISGLRSRIMVILYNEGYSPSIVGYFFNRTPSAVIRAVERIEKSQ